MGITKMFKMTCQMCERNLGSSPALKNMKFINENIFAHMQKILNIKEM